MKTLTLIRHAKATWEKSDWQDFERPLNERGYNDAALLASKLTGYFIEPDVIISSPAVRAFTTAEIFIEKVPFKNSKFIKDIFIYEKGAKYILNLVKNLDSNVNSAMIFGHNPDITSLSTYYSGDFFENVPTCGIICLVFDTDDWQDTAKNNGKIKFFVYPKIYK